METSLPAQPRTRLTDTRDPVHRWSSVAASRGSQYGVEKSIRYATQWWWRTTAATTLAVAQGTSRKPGELNVGGDDCAPGFAG
jgi:hypothetical protein